MRHKLLTATLFATTMAPGGQTDEPVPEKQVAALSEQHRRPRSADGGKQPRKQPSLEVGLRSG